jgi:protein SCO1
MLKIKPSISLIISIIIVSVVGLVYGAKISKQNESQAILDGYLAETPPSEIGDIYLGEELIPPIPFPKFKLINYTGDAVSNEDLHGKIVLLSFAYTSCPDTCPIIFSKFLVLQKEFEEEIGNEIELVFMTVDPEVDTPERLSAHVLAMGGKWQFLTESLEVMTQTWQDLKIFVEKEGNIVNHSNLMYLIDENGLLRVQYNGLPPESVFISDITKLINE